MLAILCGFGLGGAFGLWEQKIKDHLAAEAKKVETTVYQGDAAKMKAVVDKSWVYIKRAHMHGGGIGAAALAVILLLALGRGPDLLKGVAAVLLGVGSLGYSVFWMLAALRAPGLGSTGAAKDSLRLLALPSTGLCLVGLVLALLLLCFTCCCCGREAPGEE